MQGPLPAGSHCVCMMKPPRPAELWASWSMCRLHLMFHFFIEICHTATQHIWFFWIAGRPVHSSTQASWWSSAVKMMASVTQSESGGTDWKWMKMMLAAKGTCTYHIVQDAFALSRRTNQWDEPLSPYSQRLCRYPSRNGMTSLRTWKSWKQDLDSRSIQFHWVHWWEGCPSWKECQLNHLNLNRKKNENQHVQP